MLPAPQMRPDGLPKRQGHDSMSSVAGGDDGEGDAGRGGCGIPIQRRSFPIRISQSSQHVAHLGLHHRSLPEHRLRRKTPGGTVDAGYDGSHIQSAPGPPLKHVVLPGPSNPKLLPALNQMPASPPRYVNHATLSIPFDHAVQPQASCLPYSWTCKDGPSSISNRMSSTNDPSVARYPDPNRPVIRANEHNVGAFCPPPAPHSGSLLLGQTASYPAFSQWDYRKHHQAGQFGPGSAVQGVFRPAPASLADASLRHHPLTLGNHGMLSIGNHALGGSRRPAQSCQGSGVALPSTKTAILNGHPGSRDKALRCCYQSYVDLLSYLQANGRTNPKRTNPTTFDVQKLPAYPKPPSLWRAGMVTSTNSTSSRFFLPHNPGTAMPRPRRFVSDGTDGAGINLAHQSLRNEADSMLPSSAYASPAKHLPIANALSSLQMLRYLCEESHWKWIDGMLLGGCLHYGLDMFNEALKYFSRIVTVDQGHVEAITHMGAALYCLGRQDEAEESWLRAVKLQPSRLDATEHLVGHLYKNRSEEAVEVVSFVQRCSLRATQVSSSDDGRRVVSDASNGKHCSVSNDPAMGSMTPAGCEDDGTGFGSSGYLLPGVDNGRMLALVHAKGTMLYGQKDIERASEAFQEAVLISVGGRVGGIQELIHRIRLALSPQSQGSKRSDGNGAERTLQPLMLPPERARHTARLLFGGNGEMPGLVHVRDGPSKRAAVQTTSNSLLSLAKILQDAMSNGSADSFLLHGASQVSDILTLYYLSLSLQESPSTANNVGILLAGFQQHIATTAMAALSRASLPRPGMPGITPGSGLALALSYYHYGLRLDPNHVHLHTNLGSLLKDIGQLDLAIQMYERAVLCDGAFDIALTNLANAVKDKGRINEAIVYYRRAVRANPRFAEAVCGLFTALNSICGWRGRGGVLLQAGQYDRWHVDDDGRLVDGRIRGCSSGLAKRVVDIVAQQLEGASHWGAGVLQEAAIVGLANHLQPLCETPSFKLDAALRRWAGQPWEGSRVLRLLERATRIIQRRWYADLQHTAGQGDGRYSRPTLPRNLAVPPAPTVLPFHTFTCPLSAGAIRTIAQRNASRISFLTLRSPWITSTVCPPPDAPDPRLNVGYLSSDFNNHPLAHLMQSVFGLHSPSRVQAICYATTPSDGSIHRRQIEDEAPVFRDVSNWPSDKLINQIGQDNIHILVNLNGYTRGARNDIFAARPAPIQMSFMGFAGTLGAQWCDYLLADETAIPPSTLRPWRSNVSIEDVFRDNNEGLDGDWMYSENIIFCRETFFCCDHAQSCTSGEMGTKWAEVERQRWEMRKQLFPDMEDDVVILGNFNQLYKIDPTTFRCWLRILGRVPRAVLWLLRFPEPGEGNLRATARLWAGPEVASRILFTDVAPKNRHISRARVCDLFLDTPECNAHTTAADVLWSSTPLLTFPRYPYKMCSRMAASILRGALPRSAEGRLVAEELTAEAEEDYEQRATDLANGLTYTVGVAGHGQGKGRLADMRKLLWDSKRQCSLFDTRRWVEDLETAYEQAWDRWVRGVGGDIYL